MIGSPKNPSIVTELYPLGLFASDFLYYESVLNLMHDIEERNAQINILNLFSRMSNSHHYFTRSSTSQKSMYKRMRSLLLAQRYGMRCQIALKTYRKRRSEKNLMELY